MKRTIIILAIVTMLAALGADGCSSQYITSAKLYYNQKKYDKVVEVCDKELAANPKSGEAYLFKGKAYKELGEYDKMAEALNKAIEVDPKAEQEATILLKGAWADEVNGGIGFFNKAIKASEDSSGAYYEKSIERFDNAIMLMPDSSNAYINKAIALNNLGKQLEAAEVYENLVAKTPHEGAYQNMSQIYLSAASVAQTEGKDAEAKELYEKSIEAAKVGAEHFPDNTDLLTIMQDALLRSGRRDEAREMAKTAVEKDPDNSQSQYLYGVLLAEINDYENAVTHLQKAYELNNEFTEVLYRLAHSYYFWGTSARQAEEESENVTGEYKKLFEKSREYCEMYLELEPEEGRAWSILTNVYINLNMIDEAQEAKEKADMYRK